MQFGTDGIRGRADDAVTVSVAFRLGRAVAAIFPDTPCFVGCDTRESSARLVDAAVAGLREGGVTPVNLGVISTPGVAFAAAQRQGTGLVISASHNPYFDNGLKVLGPRGTKLDRATEQLLEQQLEREAERDGPFEVAAIDPSGATEYVDHLRSLFPPDALAGLRLVLDCANGAASALAPELFRSLGATVDVIHAEPDGTNINRDCGSTHPGSLRERVVATSSDVGLAFDGDADRLIAVDARGVVRDGDDLMVVFAQDLLRRGEWGGALVVTQMSNLGLHRAMRSAGIPVVEVEVGDRAVLLALESGDHGFGGEQSGHLIFRRLSPTGDGMLTGVLLGELVRRRGPLAEVAEDAWRRLPQHLMSVPRDLFDAAAVEEARRAAVARFGVSDEDYRLLVRPSGTEPVMRVMIEALDGDFVHDFVARVARAHAVAP